jgi:hypothetical protein
MQCVAKMVVVKWCANIDERNVRGLGEFSQLLIVVDAVATQSIGDLRGKTPVIGMGDIQEDWMLPAARDATGHRLHVFDNPCTGLLDVLRHS